MNIEKILVKLSLILSLMVVGLCGTSCSDKGDDIIDNPSTPPQEEPQPEEGGKENEEESGIKPGDDFYSYANAEWLESLENADPEEVYGWAEDIIAANEEYLEAVKAEMPQYAVLKSDLAKLEQTHDASVSVVVYIAEKLTEDIKTKKDAYIAYGKAIKLGITGAACLHLGICSDDNTFGFLIMPPIVPEEGEMEAYSNHPSDVKIFKSYERYAPVTRAGKSTIDYILEGIGIDPKYYIHNEISEKFAKALEQVSLNDLKEIISGAIQSELIVYCGDEYVKQGTEGAVESVAEFLDMTIENDLGYFTSYYFSNKYITEDLQNTYHDLSINLIDTFRNRLQNNEWLSPATQQAAIDKLDNMGMSFGAPTKWPVVEMPQLEGDMLLIDVLEIKSCRYNVIKSLMGAPSRENLPVYAMFTSENQEPIYTYEYNAFYVPTFNQFYVAAPFMMAPAYNKDADEAELYGTIGAIIGHEITHGFDQEGANYDKYGAVNDWWTVADMSKFAELNLQVINNISTFELIPGLKANGAQTVTEDVADLGGLNIAHDALVKRLEEQGYTGDQLVEAKKKFYTSYAHHFAMKAPDSYIVENYVPDEHSIGHIRVNAVVQQIDDWYELYGVKEENALYLAPDKRIKIW